MSENNKHNRLVWYLLGAITVAIVVIVAPREQKIVERHTHTVEYLPDTTTVDSLGFVIKTLKATVSKERFDKNRYKEENEETKKLFYQAIQDLDSGKVLIASAKDSVVQVRISLYNPISGEKIYKDIVVKVGVTYVYPPVNQFQNFSVFIPSIEVPTEKEVAKDEIILEASYPFFKGGYIGAAIGKKLESKYQEKSIFSAVGCGVTFQTEDTNLDIVAGVPLSSPDFAVAAILRWYIYKPFK